MMDRARVRDRMRDLIFKGSLHVLPLTEKKDEIREGQSEYGVAPNREIDPIGAPPRPEWVHYIAGLARGKWLAENHETHDGSFKANERARYLATVVCDDQDAAFAAFWRGLIREYW